MLAEVNTVLWNSLHHFLPLQSLAAGIHSLLDGSKDPKPGSVLSVLVCAYVSSFNLVV